MQEYAFVPIVERSVEGQHRSIKLHTNNATGVVKPGAVCASLRWPTTKLLLHENKFLNFAVANWEKQLVLHPLVAHLLSRADFRRLTTDQRYTRIYQYSRTDQYNLVEGAAEETAEAQNVQTAFEKAHTSVQARPPVSTTPNAQVCIDFLRSRLADDFVFSVPLAIMDTAVAEIDAVPVPGTLELVSARTELVPFEPPGDTAQVFFRVTAVNPRAQVYQKVGHKAEVKSEVHISIYEVAETHYDRDSVALSANMPTDIIIDLLAWCFPDVFARLLQNLVRWQAEKVSTELLLIPFASSTVARVPQIAWDDAGVMWEPDRPTTAGGPCQGPLPRSPFSPSPKPKER
jgi:hypothetical protein